MALQLRSFTLVAALTLIVIATRISGIVGDVPATLQTTATQCVSGSVTINEKCDAKKECLEKGLNAGSGTTTPAPGATTASAATGTTASAASATTTSTAATTTASTAATTTTATSGRRRRSTATLTVQSITAGNCCHVKFTNPTETTTTYTYDKKTCTDTCAADYHCCTTTSQAANCLVNTAQTGAGAILQKSAFLFIIPILVGVFQM